AGYLTQVRALCDEQGWLLLLDEVQTGMCRTGKWFAYQHEGVLPDVMTLAKALGNGVPIGACLARGRAAELIQPGQHASTFGGNPLACRAALAVVNTLEGEGLAARAAELGSRLLTRLGSSLSGVEGVRGMRGKGLMLGIELDRPCPDLVGQALAVGLLINVTAERVVRLLPPLILKDTEAEQIVEQVTELITDFLEARPSSR
ncbi:MAG TPA: aminotransferase class III-fold pyridoxal phosphate-dependent enzyme, partial [Gammaproteobacteria bacterium]|nr:aminotransferase class III-fold pyridoxal phosphate-dependent enzyme [Gammaproteobacteria bacterium]